MLQASSQKCGNERGRAKTRWGQNTRVPWRARWAAAWHLMCPPCRGRPRRQPTPCLPCLNNILSGWSPLCAVQSAHTSWSRQHPTTTTGEGPHISQLQAVVHQAGCPVGLSSGHRPEFLYSYKAWETHQSGRMFKGVQETVSRKRAIVLKAAAAAGRPVATGQRKLCLAKVAGMLMPLHLRTGTGTQAQAQASHRDPIEKRQHPPGGRSTGYPGEKKRVSCHS